MVSHRLMSRSLLAVAACVAFAGIVIASLAGAVANALEPQLSPGWKTTVIDQQVAGMTGENPQLDGDYVVYLDTLYKEISLYQISTGVTKQIVVLPDGAQADSLCIDGRYVAWQVQSSLGMEANRGVWLYDIVAGGAPERLWLTVGVDIDVSGNRVVWRGPSLRTAWDLYVYDTAVNACRPLGLDTFGISHPAIDGDHLVWAQGSGADRDVMLFDLSTDSLLNLSGARGSGLADYDPRVSDGRVVWVGEDGSDSEVFFYDISSGKLHQLTNDSRNCQAPLVDGRWVTWAVGSDLMLADAQAGNPPASARFIMGDGSGESGTYWSHALGGGWAVCSRDGAVWRYDITTGDLAQATELDVGLPGSYRAFDVQTNGSEILVKMDRTEAYLLEETSGGTTTTTAPPSTTTTTTVPPGPGANTFWDVPPSHPYYEPIEGMAGAGIIGGYTDGSFGPSNPVMRQQFAKMIVGTLGFPCSEADVCPFGDVTVGGLTTLYPDNYIAVAAHWGITNGYPDGTFGPYRNITRAQMITMVVRAAQQYTAGLQTPDAAYSQWGLFSGFGDPTHGYNVQMAEFNGLLNGIQGSGNTATWVWQPASRGEVAQILWNLCNAPVAG